MSTPNVALIEPVSEPTKHTPGPWLYTKGSIYDANDVLIALPVGPPGIAEACQRNDWTEYDRIFAIEVANACLIAAAPDMLAALQDMLFHFGNPKRDEWLNDAAFKQAKAADARARAAIAKAVGGLS